MIFCKELNKSFATKELMFAELVKEKANVIALKKAAIKNSDGIAFVSKHSTATKAAGASIGTIKAGDTISPVINSTMIMDSHSDVHLDGIWNKSVSQQAGKVYYIINHDLEIGKVIAYPKNVTLSIERISWKELNQPYEGDTECLVFKVLITEASNKDFLAAINSGEDLEGSIRMQYVTIDLAISTNDPDYSEANALFNQWIGKIVNKEAVIEQGYFWAVSEAKIHKEGSALLADCASNPATTQRRKTIDQPPTSIDNTAPPTSTQPKQFFYNPNL